MLRPRTALVAVTGLFTAALLLSLVTHGTGVVRNDPTRNIWIPPELTMPLQLQVAFNGQLIFLGYRWPAAQPHVFSEVLRYGGGKWQRELRTPVGLHPNLVAEDRLSMMVDDGSDASHRRKYLPATRKDPADWHSLADPATLDAQRRAGYFLDLWHWRAALLVYSAVANTLVVNLLIWPVLAWGVRCSARHDPAG